MSEVVRRAAETLAVGLSLLREGAFFRAHEHFEDAWRQSAGTERTIWHALAQLSAAHHQLSLGRARASARTWKKAREKLAQVGLLSAELDARMQAFHAALGVSEDGARFVSQPLPDVRQWPTPELTLRPAQPV